MNINYLKSALITFGIAISLTAIAPAFAATYGITGTVSSVSGDIVTINSNHALNSTSTSGTVYTVDATNAAIYKNTATSSVSAISVGDTLRVQGTVDGTTVAATVIRDYSSVRVSGHYNNSSRERSHVAFATENTKPSPTISFRGDANPVIVGILSSVSGTNLVIENANNIDFTVDASNANIQKNNVGTTTVSALNVGDELIVQGTFNETLVTASTIIDQGTTSHSGVSTRKHSNFLSILGGISQFFGRLFSF